jgi:hypothetical protein
MRHAELRRAGAVQGREINDLVRVRLLPLRRHDDIPFDGIDDHPQDSWPGVVLLAATCAACGGATQAATGTAPSEVLIHCRGDRKRRQLQSAEGR